MTDDPQMDAPSVEVGRVYPQDQDPATGGRAHTEPARVERWMLPSTGVGWWSTS